MKRFLIAFLLGALMSGGFTYMTVSASPEIYEKQVITVHTGDTLWDIAADWSGRDEDIREVILRIQKENKLSGSDLAVGQRLVIPVRKTVADVVAEQNERNVGKAQLAAR
ncbi:LysM peptidoglycan-binding domain-containing protein [Succiniclasticum ruminis]|jgi:LysM repeat protein|uniref:LysM domain-containing protein n=1 Tax=Succiniclasticum ruminis DSM 9236 TaxID=1123323 RepID=A0A1I2A3K6_9FIRM|nr:LysM peptidoglycan-binding domain-containing protein [Succiniclasticum ruminis]SFE38542.1 LysM domain-containing protein [Succiniclasticum ruminis DSM 9236]